MMPTATDLEPTAAPPRVYSTATLADYLAGLGDIPPDRVRTVPPMGTATTADLIEARENDGGRVCERVDGTLVEKSMSWYESWLATFLIRLIGDFVEDNALGIILAPDGMLNLLPQIDRAPDVSFLAWSSLPGGRPPQREDRVPTVAPTLAVEVLSESNRPGEMARKRVEYFRAGVARVWEIDPDTRTARVYTAAETFTEIPVDGQLDGEHFLPGLCISLSHLFARMDRLGNR